MCVCACVSRGKRVHVGREIVLDAHRGDLEDAEQTGVQHHLSRLQVLGDGHGEPDNKGEQRVQNGVFEDDNRLWGKMAMPLRLLEY